MASRRIQSNKVLDLRQTEPLRKLGILNEVEKMVVDGSHLDGQMLGHMARRLDFEALIVPSHYGSGVNLIIFK